MVSIYALINPLNNQVFYVGATEDPVSRLSAHKTSLSGKTEKRGIIIAIRNSGLNLEMFILDTCHKEDVQFWEEFYIDLFFSFGFDLKQRRKSFYCTDSLPHRSFINKDGFDIYTLNTTCRGELCEVTVRQRDTCISNTDILDTLFVMYHHKIEYIKSAYNQIENNKNK